MSVVSVNAGTDLQIVEGINTLLLGGFVFQKTNLYPFPFYYKPNPVSGIYSVGGLRYSIYSGRVINNANTKIKPMSILIDNKLEFFQSCGVVGGDVNDVYLFNLAVNQSSDYPAFSLVKLYENSEFHYSGYSSLTWSDTNKSGYVTKSFGFKVVDSSSIIVNGVVADSSNNKYAFFDKVPTSGTMSFAIDVSDNQYIGDVPLRYLGKIGQTAYFGGFFNVGDNGQFGILAYSLSDDTKTINFFNLKARPDFDIVHPAIAGVYREDGSIYAVIIYRLPDGTWDTQVFFINASDGSMSELAFTFDSNGIDTTSLTPISGSYCWAADTAIQSGKGIFVHTFYIDEFGIPPVYGNTSDLAMLFYLDETNSKVVLKDYKYYDASLSRGIVPLDSTRTSFYVLGDLFISLLKIDGDSLLLARDVEPSRDIVGVDELGRIWSSDAGKVYLMPIYEPYKRIELSFETPLTPTDTYPVNNNLIVKLYNENGNRISGNVELVVTTGNMIFADNNSYSITVAVDDGTNGDTKVAVKITAAGLIEVEGVIL